HRPFELARQIRTRFGDDAEAQGGCAVVCGGTLAEREGEIRQSYGRIASEERDDLLTQADDLVARSSGEETHVRIPRRLTPGGVRLIGPFFENHVPVDAAKPECVDRGAARRRGAAVNPRPRLGIDVEGGAFELQPGARFGDVQRRWKQL